MNNIMGGLYRVSEWIMRFSVTNILWLLFNLPIVYVSFGLLYAEDMTQLIFAFITISILSPIFFFPATTAMFGVVRRWVMGDESASLVKSFWKFYKENYKKSLLGGLILVPIWIVWIVDYFYLSQFIPNLFIVFVVGIVFLSIFTIHFFANLVHFELKLMTLIKNSFFLTIGKPFLTLALAITNGTVFFVSFYIFTFAIPFFMGSVASYLSFVAFYSIVNQFKSAQSENGTGDNTN